ncbi:MAG: ABC transporter permease [Anaerolineaceae bacterium]|nr:ABC transporter permease [Anaerolineaceae bacterium]
MSSGNSVMQLETGTGWTRGLNNLLRGELGRWFGTRQWWVQVLIWAAVANGIPLMAVLGAPDSAGMELPMLFNVFLGIGAPIGVCILMQDAIVGEKQSGTAAWVLSKPVSRLAFLTSKLVGNGLGIAATMVLAPGLLMYLASALIMDTPLPPLGFLAGLGAHLVNLLFYVGLTLLLGARFDHGAPVIGLPLAFLFAQQYLPGLAPELVHVIPWSLTAPLGGSSEPVVTTALMTGVAPASYLPLVTTLAVAVLCVAGAIWIFRRQDL